MPKLSGNKGEWSEIYAFLRLLEIILYEHSHQTKGLCKLQSPFSLKPADFLNLRALLNLLQSSI